MKKKTIWDLHRDSITDFRAKQKTPLTLVVDNVRSLNNIGSMFRTCDAFALERIILCGISACPPSPEIHKTALGAEDSVDWVYYESTLDAVAALHADGYTVCALEQVAGSVSLEAYMPEPGSRYAVIVGNEVDGVGQDVVDASDVCLEIPQRGTKHSLNVAVSAALAIWQFYLRLGVVALMIASVAATSCRTNEKTYRSAYERALEKRTVDIDSTIYSAIRREARAQEVVIGNDTLALKAEYVKVTPDLGTDKSALKRYNVVVAAFKQLFHAKSLKSRYISAGFDDAFVVETREPLYYVVAFSTDDAARASAVADSIKASAPVRLQDDCPWVLSPASRRL